MGLLDFDNADSRLGLGLLAAASARSDGAGFGRRLAEAVGSVDAWRQQQAKDAFMKMQMDNYASEIAQRNMQIQKQAELQKMLMDELTPKAQQPQLGQLGSGAYGIVPTAPGVDAVPSAKNGGIANMSLDKLAKFKLMGADLTDIYKLSRPNLTNVNGTLVDSTDPANANRYVADPTKGFGFNPATNSVSVLPGFLKANADIEGGKAEVQEAAKAKYDPFTFTPKGASNPVLTTRGAVVSGSPQPGITGEGYSGGSRDAANAESIRMMQSEIDKLPPNHPDIPVIQREIARLQTQSGTPRAGGIELQSEADKVKAVKQAEADVQGTDARQNAIAAGNLMSRQIDKVLNSPGLETGTGLSGKLHPSNYIPGTDATNFRVALDQIKGQTFLQAFNSLKSGGQITEIEGKKATDAIARLDTAQSTPEFKAALNDLQSVVQDSLSRMRESSGRAGTPVNPANTGGVEKPQSNMVATLADIAATAKASGRSTAEVTAALRKKGYTIGGM